jgi:hypothetical protein
MVAAMKSRARGTSVYRQDRKSVATARTAGSCAADQGEISPVYRGFKLKCFGNELPAKQRAIDEFWSRAYLEAQSPAAWQAVFAQEKEWRGAPREWV